MLQLHVQTTLPLAKPLDDQGFVTWLDVHAIDRNAATGELTKIARARVAIVRVAAMFSAVCNVEETLKAEGLNALTSCIEAYDYIFGLDLSDLLYLAHFKLEGTRRPQNLDVALVQLIHDTLAHACALVVVPCVDLDHERWTRAGFEVEPGTYNPTYLCWDTRDPQDRVEVVEPREPDQPREPEPGGAQAAQPAVGSAAIPAGSPQRGATPSGPLTP